MRKGTLIGVGTVSAIIVVLIVLASYYVPDSSDLSPAQNGSAGDQIADNDSKVISIGKIRQVMTLRTDLGGSPVVIDRPFFLQLKDSSDNGTVNATEVLKVAGARSADVDVRTYSTDGPMVAWSPVDTPDGVEGPLNRSEGLQFQIDDDAAVLIMITIRTPGAYSISVNASDAANGTSLAPPVTMGIVVEDAAVPYLFTAPEIRTEYTSGWMLYVANGSSMPFTIGARPTDLWQESRPVTPTPYNWTVTVIDPDGLMAYDDLVPFNQGIANLDPTSLVNTSVDSTWSWGMGSPYHVVWDSANGVRLEGSNITTPTTKEMYNGGTQMAWHDGTWEPSGNGEMTFHQAGHYIFLLALTLNGRAVSAPLVLETIVS